MKASQVAALVLRLLGVYCILQTILQMPAIYDVIRLEQNKDLAGMVPLLLLSKAMPVILGFLLIACSAHWGEKLAPKDTNDEKMPIVSLDRIQGLAFAVAGVLILASSLPELCFQVLDFLHDVSLNGSLVTYVYTTPFVLAPMVAAILRTALGVFLFFGANGVANFWGSMRNFATPKPPQGE